MPDLKLFVTVYHRFNKMQYRFVYDISADCLDIGVEEMRIDGATERNFPIKSFYSATHNELYTFYRQGYCYTLSP